jgi:GrpB-like predicted nucleotidyltransferase (UPF0157 family)
MAIEIRDYQRQHPSYQDYDPNAPVVAEALISAITSLDPRLRVEHIGSSSIPGCCGKGYIDLLVVYSEGHLEHAKQVLVELGYQRQTGRHPFPESRPMRVGRVELEGRHYPIHAHVVAESSTEVAQMLSFRDRLRADPSLARAYEAEKRRVLSEGVLDGEDYAERKGGFVQSLLDADHLDTGNGG